MTVALAERPALPAPVNSHRKPGRDRYIDTLRALALIRVVLYHLTGWAWLPLVFPSMGVMFAIGGSLVAASLARADHWQVLRKRLRRLLPPLWAMGLILVPIMLLVGWSANSVSHQGTPLGWSLLYWVLPLSTPPASEWGHELVVPLWYIRTYLWLLLLSPALLWLFRRWPVAVFVAPLAVLCSFAVGLTVDNGSRSDAVTISVATFTMCWLLGFAHHDGLIRAWPRRLVVPVALAAMAAAAGWAITHPAPGQRWNLDADPLTNAVYCAAFVLLLLRFYPSFDGLGRVPVLDGLVRAFTARAVTIYLWGNVALAIAIWLSHEFLAGRLYGWDQVGTARTVQFALAWAVIAVAVLALGWVEDVAGGRRPTMRPWRARSAP
jgi:peptidoglycan/LPS O-acetylase OafA/YrhL